MKRFFQGMVLGLATLLSAVLPCVSAVAADKPTLVVSFSGIDELLNDIGYLCEAAGQPQAAKQASFLITAFTQGIDRTKPVGAVITVKSQEDIEVLAFIPVSDLKTVFKTIEAQIGEPRDAGQGAFELELPGAGPLFIKEQGGFAFLARSLTELGKLPADPTTLVGGMNKEYDLGIKFFMQNLPEEMRKQFVEQVKMGMELAQEQNPDEDEAVFELRKKMMAQSAKNFEQLVTDLDSFLLGWNCDSKTKRTFLDFGATCVPGSKMAKQISGLSDAKTDYNGFLRPDAAVTMNFTSYVANPDPEQLDQMKTTMASVREMINKQLDKDENLDGEKRTQAKEIVGTLMDVAEKTLASGKMDGGASVVLKPKSLAIVGGGYVADGPALEGILKKLAEMEKDNPEFPKFKYDTEKVGDVRLHTAKVAVPDEEARAALGAETDVVVGVSDKKFFFGIGRDAAATLKEVLEKSASAPATPTLPLQMNVSLAPIFQFAKSIADDEDVAALADVISADGKDKVMIQLRPVPNGFNYRIEVEGGIIKLIGAAAQRS